MKKIAFFGGSFNPPNNSHINIAKLAIKKFNLDNVYFVPVGNYYKKDGLIDVKYRYEMLKIATKNCINMKVSDITLKETNNLKAIDIFKKIKQLYSNDDIYYIMGADNFLNILNWKNATELISNFKIIIIGRDNIDLKSYILKSELLKDNIDNFYVINNLDEASDNQDVFSSTYIRTKIKNGESISKLTNEEVIEYIEENKLYVKNA